MWALVAAQKPADEGPPAWVRRPRFGALPEGRIVVAEEALAQSAVVGRGGRIPAMRRGFDAPLLQSAVGRSLHPRACGESGRCSMPSPAEARPT
jgi:hypothetical protein